MAFRKYKTKEEMYKDAEKVFSRFEKSEGGILYARVYKKKLQMEVIGVHEI